MKIYDMRRSYHQENSRMFKEYICTQEQRGKEFLSLEVLPKNASLNRYRVPNVPSKKGVLDYVSNHMRHDFEGCSEFIALSLRK